MNDSDDNIDVDEDEDAPEHPAERAIREKNFVGGLHPFALFCLYHLGLHENGETSFMNVHQVAQALASDLDTVTAALQAYGLDADTLLHSEFELASAQADIQVSPAGVDLFCLAEMHFDALCAARQKRDWEDELRKDAAHNLEFFGGSRGKK